MRASDIKKPALVAEVKISDRLQVRKAPAVQSEMTRQSLREALSYPSLILLCAKTMKIPDAKINRSAKHHSGVTERCAILMRGFPTPHSAV
jgi:hypothetical protein